MGNLVDEFSLLVDNASEAGIAWLGQPVVRRASITVSADQAISALVWGDGEPEWVFCHGGAQNAHTWDTTLLAMGQGISAICVDLPGHGRSDWRTDQMYNPITNALAIIDVIRQVARRPVNLVGMSLGGLTSICMTAQAPELIKRVAIVDVTPGTNREKSKAISDFVRGPQYFDSFDELLTRTMQHNPTRTESSLRRGILHNARELDDGRWQWVYDRLELAAAPTERAPALPEGLLADDMGFNPLWEEVSKITAPIMMLRGATSPVVDDADIAEFVRRQPTTRVEVVANAGHSIQGDQPVELARLLNDWAASGD